MTMGLRATGSGFRLPWRRRVQILARLPIRTRLTLVFAAAMAVVLVAMGVFLYVGLGSALDEAIDVNLRTRADDVAALIRQSESGLQESAGNPVAETAEQSGQSFDQGESFAQVLSSSGAVVDATSLLGQSPLLTSAELARAMKGPITLELASVPGLEGTARLLAAPVYAQDQDLVIVVGASLEGRTEALSRLESQLGIGGPLALIAACLLAYALASAAFRPVESMRRQAEAISAVEPGRRLPVPAARDEVAKLGATLNEMLARLESALAKERAFVSNASHELRTPLTLLKAELDLALSRERSTEEMAATLRSAAEETDSLVQLAEDLLVLARADQGRLPVTRAIVDGREILEGVRERFSRRASDMGMALEVDAPNGLQLSGDRVRLEQALTNMVENALRYGASPVLLRVLRQGDQVEFHVLDRGPGFEEDFLPHAFERFSRADESRSTGGAGLGLPIVGIIALAHGGTADAANREGGGADVWLEIPLKAARKNLGAPQA
jgi:two-component system OmpR family sensor kinase